MRVLLTGATGYIGQRLLPLLLEKGHEVVCCVRDVSRLDRDRYPSKKLSVIEVNFLKRDTLDNIPGDIDVAFYLIHSMATNKGDFSKMEDISARYFRESMENTSVKQVIYLSGIVNEDKLSKHLSSRKNVEEILSSGSFALTTLRAGIIVGSGSASFEIIRDLVEKLPLMVAPRWLNTPTQPIAIRNVLQYLDGVMMNERTYNKSYDIGGKEILTYREMLLRFARVRGLKRRILVLPVMTPRLSSYWLYFVTSTSYSLAKNLVDSMKVPVIGKKNDLNEILNVTLVEYEQAIRLAFGKIEQNQVISSWKDALTSNILNEGISRYVQVPVGGCFKDVRTVPIKGDVEEALERIWSIGGKNGWYYANWLWQIRGVIDKMVGGVGLRRGRKNPSSLSAGESLDFWRVLYASRRERRLLAFAEMKLPGEAWLEFRINERNELVQTATFRPLGIKGRLYWYAVLPFHGVIFNGMARKIAG